jgi:hypothetical protein
LRADLICTEVHYQWIEGLIAAAKSPGWAATMLCFEMKVAMDQFGALWRVCPWLGLHCRREARQRL